MPRLNVPGYGSINLADDDALKEAQSRLKDVFADKIEKAKAESETPKKLLKALEDLKKSNDALVSGVIDALKNQPRPVVNVPAPIVNIDKQAPVVKVDAPIVNVEPPEVVVNSDSVEPAKQLKIKGENPDWRGVYQDYTVEIIR